MRCTLALLLVAACGDDGGVHSLPDAPTTADAPIDQPLGCTTVDADLSIGRGLVFGGDGTLYYASPTGVGRVRPCQPPEPDWVATTRPVALMLDPANAVLYAGAQADGTIYAIDYRSSAPTATAAVEMKGVEGLTLGPDGALYAVNTDQVVRIANGIETEVTPANLSNPKALAFAADGTLLVAEYSGLIHRLTLTNGVETGRAIFAQKIQAFVGLMGIALDADGHAFLTNGDGGDLVVEVDEVGRFIDSYESGLGGQLDFAAGPFPARDLYVASSGLVRLEREVVGAAVPWHAP